MKSTIQPPATSRIPSTSPLPAKSAPSITRQVHKLAVSHADLIRNATDVLLFGWDTVAGFDTEHTGPTRETTLQAARRHGVLGYGAAAANLAAALGGTAAGVTLMAFNPDHILHPKTSLQAAMKPATWLNALQLSMLLIGSRAQAAMSRVSEAVLQAARSVPALVRDFEEMVLQTTPEN